MFGVRRLRSEVLKLSERLDTLERERQDRLCKEGKHLEPEKRSYNGSYWLACPNCRKDMSEIKKNI